MYQSLLKTAPEPPWVRHSATSRQSAVEIKAPAVNLRALVYGEIINTGGATDQEIQQALNLDPSTQRPRRVELVHMGQVRDSGRKRKTVSGRMAVVWVACG